MLERSLRRGQRAAHIDVDHAVHLFQRGRLERLRDGCAGIVHKHIEPAKRSDGPFDRGFDRFDVGQRPPGSRSPFARSSIALTTAEAAPASFAYVKATLAPSAARRFTIAARCRASRP